MASIISELDTGRMEQASSCTRASRWVISIFAKRSAIGHIPTCKTGVPLKRSISRHEGRETRHSRAYLLASQQYLISVLNVSQAVFHKRATGTVIKINRNWKFRCCKEGDRCLRSEIEVFVLPVTFRGDFPSPMGAPVVIHLFHAHEKTMDYSKLATLKVSEIPAIPARSWCEYSMLSVAQCVANSLSSARPCWRSTGHCTLGTFGFVIFFCFCFFSSTQKYCSIQHLTFRTRDVCWRAW